jgi:hypothetical protein
MSCRVRRRHWLFLGGQWLQYLPLTGTLVQFGSRIT